jgi:hypothetical protein
VINANDVLDFASRDVKQPFHKGISVDPSLIMIYFPFEIGQISLKSVVYYYVMCKKSLGKLASHFHTPPVCKSAVSPTSSLHTCGSLRVAKSHFLSHEKPKTETMKATISFFSYCTFWRCDLLNITLSVYYSI